MENLPSCPAARRIKHSGGRTGTADLAPVHGVTQVPSRQPLLGLFSCSWNRLPTGPTRTWRDPSPHPFAHGGIKPVRVGVPTNLQKITITAAPVLPMRNAMD